MVCLPLLTLRELELDMVAVRLLRFLPLEVVTLSKNLFSSTASSSCIFLTCASCKALLLFALFLRKICLPILLAPTNFFDMRMGSQFSTFD